MCDIDPGSRQGIEPGGNAGIMRVPLQGNSDAAPFKGQIDLRIFREGNPPHIDLPLVPARIAHVDIARPIDIAGEDQLTVWNTDHACTDAAGNIFQPNGPVPCLGFVTDIP